VLNGLHQLEVGGKILLSLVLLTLKVHVPEVEIEVGLGVNGGDNDETTLGGPVNTVAGLLIDRPNKLEVTSSVALLLRGEEGDGGLGGNGNTGRGLAVGNEDETRTVRLPREVDDSVLETVDDLDRHTLLANPEDLEVGGHRLLGLGVTVDLDANIGTLGLPVDLDIGNVEQVTGADNLPGGNTHHGDTGGVATDLGSPEAEKLLVCLDTLAGNSGGGPLKVVDTLNLHGCAAEQVHVGHLVDGNGLALVHTRAVLLISRPFESRPLDLLLRLNFTLGGGGSSQIVGDEGAQRLSRLDIPDNNVLSVFLEGQDGLALLDLDGARGPCRQIALQRGKLNELYEGVRELFLLGEGRAAPKLDTLRVDGGKEGTLGGPLDEKLCPVSAIDDVLWWVGLVVPEHADLVVPVEGELITSVGISHPRAQVLLLLERLELGSVVFLLDASLTTIALNIHQLVHSQGVLLIERNTVQLLDGGEGLFGGLVFNKGESRRRITFQSIISSSSCV
jgi:hypothetical protein